MLVRCLIFLGQSNMIQHSTYGVGYPGGWTSDANFKIWGNGAFETYSPGSNYQNSGHWGPEAGYIAAYKADRKPQVQLHIIKHAIGSCGLAYNPSGIDFWPYSWGNPTDDHFYIAFNKIVAALNAVQASGVKAIIPTIFVVNGETDSTTQAAADAYLNNMVDFAEALRGRLWIQNAKVIIARIQDASPNGAYRGTIRSAQAQFATGFKQGMIDTDDLGVTGSPAHFSPAATVTMGERFYAAEQAIV